MRIKSIIGILLASVALAVVVFNLPKLSYSPAPQTSDLPILASTFTSTPSLEPATVPSPAPAPVIPANNPESTATPSEALAPTVTFLIGGKTYGVAAANGTNVLDAMRTIRSTQEFEFTGRDFPSLGFFVESINGKAAANGYVWIFYVNDKGSLKGISQTALNAGDTVEWRYEKSY